MSQDFDLWDPWRALVGSAPKQRFRSPDDVPRASRRGLALHARQLQLIVLGIMAAVVAVTWGLSAPSPSAVMARVACCALAIGAAWCVLAPAGPFDRWRWRRADRRWRESSDAPWTVDHRWNVRGERRRNATSRILCNMGGLAFVWIPGALFGPPQTRIATLVWGTFATVWCFRMWRTWGRGDVEIVFSRFPFHPGETVELHFGLTPGGPDVTEAQFALRRFEDRIGERGGMAWLETFAAAPVSSNQALPSGHADLRLVFDVPSDAGGTRLSTRLPSYWELEVSLWTTSGFVLERFLIPVYDRPVAGSAA